MSSAKSALRRSRLRCQRLAIAGVVAFGAGCFATAPSASADDVQRGKELAEQLCAVCHLNPGQGEKTGPDTIPGFAAVARRPGQTLEGIMEWLRSVPPMMPDHHLSQDEMEAIGFFILSLRDAPEAPPSN